MIFESKHYLIFCDGGSLLQRCGNNLDLQPCMKANGEPVWSSLWIMAQDQGWAIYHGEGPHGPTGALPNPRQYCPSCAPTAKTGDLIKLARNSMSQEESSNGPGSSQGAM